MTQQQDTNLVRLRWYQRLMLIAGGGLLLTLLLVAACLEPDPTGFGTHQQLGLPPCTMIQFAGIRCPSCGMTTSWALMLRGQVISSLKANAGGALLALVAIPVAPWVLVSGLRGSWLLRSPNEWTAILIGTIIITITLIDWCLRCFVL